MSQVKQIGVFKYRQLPVSVLFVQEEHAKGGEGGSVVLGDVYKGKTWYGRSRVGIFLVRRDRAGVFFVQRGSRYDILCTAGIVLGYSLYGGKGPGYFLDSGDRATVFLGQQGLVAAPYTNPTKPTGWRWKISGGAGTVSKKM